MWRSNTYAWEGVGDMKDILDLLRSFDISYLREEAKKAKEEINYDKNSDRLPPLLIASIRNFYRQLDVEVNKIRDEIVKDALTHGSQLELVIDPQELNIRMRNTLPNNPTLYRKNMLEKIDLISEISLYYGAESQAIGELYVRVQDKFQDFDEISHCMRDMILAFLNEDKKAVIQTAEKFGNTLGKLYGKNVHIEALNTILQDINVYKKVKDLPSFANLYGFIQEATSEIILQMKSEQDSIQEEDLIFVYDIAKGLAAFANLINDNFVHVEMDKHQKELDNEQKRSKNAVTIEKTKPFITDYLPSTEEEKLEYYVLELTHDLFICRNNVAREMMEEVKHHPAGADYFKVEGGKEKFLVGRLISDITDQIFINPSPSLKLNVASFEATKKLAKTLDTPQNKPMEKPSVKIKKFKNVFDSHSVKTALESNPDSAVARFFKKVAYLLANFFSACTVHCATNGSLLFSHQQKLKAKAAEMLIEAEERAPKRFRK
jgi:hypothetical protein